MGNMHFRCNGQSLFCRNQIIFNICQIMHSQYIHLCINRNLYYALFLIIPIVIAACVLYYLMLYFILACPVIPNAWLPIIEPQYCTIWSPNITCTLKRRLRWIWRVKVKGCLFLCSCIFWFVQISKPTIKFAKLLKL